MSSRHRSILFAPALLVGSMLSLTLGASIAKGLFPLLGAAGTTCLRLGVGAFLLVAFWRPWRAKLSHEQ